MDNIGAEVGQKMRSAIKAKLQELGCYVDDELPDYIMVMVANKRTESQMKDDLKLFLTSKTSAFVDWLQIVLKKLKEVTVTNPEVYKKVAKRKLDDKATTDTKVKREKKEKKDAVKKTKKGDSPNLTLQVPQVKSLTDDLPIEANKLSRKRKVVIVNDVNNTSDTVNDVFDIPPLSAVTTTNENEISEPEHKLANVKSRLGIQVRSDSDDEDFLTLKAEPDDLFPSEQTTDRSKLGTKFSSKITSKQSSLNNEDFEDSNRNSQAEKAKHARITFEPTEDSQKKKSVYERLGKQNDEKETVESNVDLIPKKKTKISISEIQKEEEKLLGSWRSRSDKENNQEQTTNSLGSKRDSILKRLGVKSKVLVPSRDSSLQEEKKKEEPIIKEVLSVVKPKPRVFPPTTQPNKNLLLKAVAEAQRSIAQTPVVGNNLSPKSLLANRNKTENRKLSDTEKSKIRNILVQVEKTEKTEVDISDDDNLEYVPKPVKRVLKSGKEVEYIPTFKDAAPHDSPPNDGDSTRTTLHQRFVITLDGLDKNKCKEIKTVRNPEFLSEMDKISNNSTVRRKSPITFTDTRPNVPEKLPIVFPPAALKTKERCKYWPACNKGEKCEYIHPNTACKNFPRCKFGDKCLYIHPPCKFDTSCTKKDCPFSHLPKTHMNGLFLPTQLQQCKFFPNCTNVHCTFYHPRPCKYGKFCKNKNDCNFFHVVTPVKHNTQWRN